MPTLETSPGAAPAADPFPSLAELRVAHQELLKVTRSAGPDPDQVRAFLARARATGVVLNTVAERDQAQSMLDYWTARLYSLSHDVPDATLADFNLALAPSLDDRVCPYIGLSAFQEGDRDKFFGREALVEEMLAKLEKNRGLLVTGPSGCGKSSLLLAGLLPALKAGRLKGRRDWRYLGLLVPRG